MRSDCPYRIFCCKELSVCAVPPDTLTLSTGTHHGTAGNTLEKTSHTAKRFRFEARCPSVTASDGTAEHPARTPSAPSSVTTRGNVLKECGKGAVRGTQHRQLGRGDETPRPDQQEVSRRRRHPATRTGTREHITVTGTATHRGTPTAPLLLLPTASASPSSEGCPATLRTRRATSAPSSPLTPGARTIHQHEFRLRLRPVDRPCHGCGSTGILSAHSLADPTSPPGPQSTPRTAGKEELVGATLHGHEEPSGLPWKSHQRGSRAEAAMPAGILLTPWDLAQGSCPPYGILL